MVYVCPPPANYDRSSPSFGDGGIPPSLSFSTSVCAAFSEACSRPTPAGSNCPSGYPCVRTPSGFRIHPRPAALPRIRRACRDFRALPSGSILPARSRAPAETAVRARMRRGHSHDSWVETGVFVHNTCICTPFSLLIDHPVNYMYAATVAMVPV